MNRHAAGVVAAVFEPLQALNKNGDDVAVRNRRDDAAHGGLLQTEGWNPKLLTMIFDF
jgi:hypothetical protein